MRFDWLDREQREMFPGRKSRAGAFPASRERVAQCFPAFIRKENPSTL